MGEPGKTYSSQSLAKWFAISSILLFVVIMAMIIQDVSRDWKSYQRQFMTMEQERLRKEVDFKSKNLNAKQKAEVDEKIKRAESSIAANEGKIKSIDVSIFYFWKYWNWLHRCYVNNRSNQFVVVWQ